MNDFAPPQSIIDAAVRTASLGPCAKSKRGVVIYRMETNPVIHGDAHNSPPWPFECSSTDACKKDCGRICVHAEQRAILQWYSDDYVTRPIGRHVDYDLVHVKVVDGKLVPSKGPSCEQCSKLIVETGITSVWLYNGGAWDRYNASTFHQLTLRHLGLHSHL